MCTACLDTHTRVNWWKNSVFQLMKRLLVAPLSEMLVASLLKNCWYILTFQSAPRLSQTSSGQPQSNPKRPWKRSLWRGQGCRQILPPRTQSCRGGTLFQPLCLETCSTRQSQSPHRIPEKSISVIFNDVSADSPQNWLGHRWTCIPGTSKEADSRLCL